MEDEYFTVMGKDVKIKNFLQNKIMASGFFTPENSPGFTWSVEEKVDVEAQKRERNFQHFLKNQIRVKRCNGKGRTSKKTKKKRKKRKKKRKKKNGKMDKMDILLRKESEREIIGVFSCPRLSHQGHHRMGLPNGPLTREFYCFDSESF